MQYITNGPNIPDELLEAQSRGEVVFFCGAGVSMPKLPGFYGLVDMLYKAVGDEPTLPEKNELNNEAYDRTLSLLEKRITGGRNEVRRKLRSILDISGFGDDELGEHESLIKLSQHSGTLRLITTNFDYFFERAAEKLGKKYSITKAPLLPPAKEWRWNGLVYLHGRLPDSDDETEYNNLVLSSGDFGLAYLTEGWAAKFVSELFRSYTVVFVGYSLNDPPLRYIMDALSAEQLITASSVSAYAFDECSNGDEAAVRERWSNLGVEAIVYENNDNSHKNLTDTLQVWADTYSAGPQGKIDIVNRNMWSPPPTILAE
ncbi:MAG: SIR2 family protein, partial [Oscillospiraceae bacterium]|nr:SIR2 family protein [Oscillospiraceae bacterium]